jgi:hypothetical protein
MAKVVMADDGIAFDGAMAEEGPLGGAETAFVALAETFARRGHEVLVHNRCRATLCHKGVRWASLSDEIPAACDLYIGNRGHRVIGLVRKARNRLFWLHNPAGYLKKPRNLWRLAWYRPTLIASGAYHAETIPHWLPCSGQEIIPYGILDRFREASPREPPPARAIFTSNPLRGLDWLLDLWVARIAPALPEAELHIYAGAAVYGKEAVPQMEEILARADTLAAFGIRRFAPIGRKGLAAALSGARVMLYRGDLGETERLIFGLRRGEIVQKKWPSLIAVAQTDECAREEAGRAVETLFNDFLRQSFEMLMPPGYTSIGSMKKSYPQSQRR